MRLAGFTELIAIFFSFSLGSYLFLLGEGMVLELYDGFCIGLDLFYVTSGFSTFFYFVDLEAAVLPAFLTGTLHDSVLAFDRRVARGLQILLVIVLGLTKTLSPFPRLYCLFFSIDFVDGALFSIFFNFADEDSLLVGAFKLISLLGFLAGFLCCKRSFLLLGLVALIIAGALDLLLLVFTLPGLFTTGCFLVVRYYFGSFLMTLLAAYFFKGRGRLILPR